MARQSRTQDTTQRPLAVAGIVLASLGVTALVVVWSLASPQRDPVGSWLSATSDHWGRLTAWRDAGPVDAQPQWSAMQLQVLTGQADRGHILMKEYGCGACHVIPDVSGAHGTVGPSLSGFAQRAYIGGVLGNTPGNLTRWLIDPPLFAPDTAMPDLDVTEADAKDLAAYLYTLDGT